LTEEKEEIYNMDYIITNSQYNLLSENVKTYNFNKKNLTDDFKLFAKVLNTTNKRTGKPYYDFSDIYPGLKIKYIEPMTKNGAEVYINVEDSFSNKDIRKWWYSEDEPSYKDKVIKRLYELKTLLGFGYDFTLTVYP
jgi:hypothetical protein